jgi:hypothetical protein
MTRLLYGLVFATLLLGQVRHESPAPAGTPVLFETALPGGTNPEAVRVFAGETSLPFKIDWRAPNARIAWVSTGAGSYRIELDGRGGRPVEPAMVGAGDRVTYGMAGVRGRLAVGLWAHPVAFDMDGDGRIDLVVGCPDRPYNGTYFFRNIGSNEKPLFARAEWIGRGVKDLVAADFNGDGALDLVISGGYFSDVRRNRMSRFVAVKLNRSYTVGRDDLWYPVDWDKDGKIDILAGVSDWTEYGWDDAFDTNGKWTRGLLHGYVYFHRNVGTNGAPSYAAPVRIDGIDTFGSPSPNPVDWFGTGKLDLLLGSFIDYLTIFRNGGTTERLPFQFDLCMIQPRVTQWHADGRPSVVVGIEDGTVVLLENTAPKGQAVRLAAPKYLEQVNPFLKSGALSRPVAVDWNGDGKLDLISGNSAGTLQYFENVGTATQPAFADRGALRAGGQVIQRIAGPNGSVQGPAEEKWGYSNPSVADWDLDGKPDILVNDIWGDVVLYRNIGSRSRPELAPAAAVEVEWPGAPPKPDWVWWAPRPKQLVTQWRTTPKVVDWDRDGLPDLVMLNHQGYLSLYRRARVGGQLRLMPPERIFVQENGRFLLLAAGRAGASGRRKIELADWDGDGDLDLITDSDEGQVWYENVGSQGKPVMRARGTVVRAKLAGHNPTPNVADWNGDGKLDVLVGGEDGFFYFFDRRFIDGLK